MLNKNTIIIKKTIPTKEVTREINKKTGESEIVWKEGGRIVKKQSILNFRADFQREYLT